MVIALHAIDVVKCLPINIIEINISSTLVVSTKAIGNFPAIYATVPSKNVTAFAFISFTCMKSIGHISAKNVARNFPNLQALTSIFECIVEKDLINVPIAVKHSPHRLY